MSNHETVDVPVEKEVEVNLDPITEQLMTPDHRKQIDDAVKRNQGHWQAGYDEGYKAGRESILIESDKRDRDLLEEHGIDVDGFVSDTVKMIEDHKGRKIDEE